MNLMDWLSHGDFATTPTNFPAVFLGLLLAFVCGHLVAWVYMKTHGGLSYSRTFVMSLTVMPLLVAMVMMVLSNNLVTAFGMMAVFAIVRIRNVIRDTLDTVYVLAVIVIGMACGTQKYTTAIMGACLVSGIFYYLWYTSFGSRNRYDIIVNLHWGRAMDELADLMGTMNRHSIRAICASQRAHEGFTGTDLSYRVLLRDPARVDEMLTEIRAVQGVSRLTSLQAQDESEL